jgi:dienelactone hydrolase
VADCGGREAGRVLQGDALVVFAERGQAGARGAGVHAVQDLAAAAQDLQGGLVCLEFLAAGTVHGRDPGVAETVARFQRGPPRSTRLIVDARASHEQRGGLAHRVDRICAVAAEPVVAGHRVRVQRVEPRFAVLDRRGSSGYGHRYQQRIYRDWGGIDLSDFEAAAAYLRWLSWVDPARIAVYGSSYGGFAALSCLSRLPDLWAAGASLCGPSNLETLVRSVPPAWRTLMADMIGDPEKDAEMLRAHSPLTYAGQITAPLFIIQGAKDPRVPKAESDQIVEKLRANGVEVRYDVYEDEGHGFTNRDNEMKALSGIAEFLIEHLHP